MAMDLLKTWTNMKVRLLLGEGDTYPRVQMCMSTSWAIMSLVPHCEHQESYGV